MDFCQKHRKWSLVLLATMGLLFISGVLFDGLGWWLLLIPLLPLLGLTIFLYDDILKLNTVLTNQIRLGLTWMSVAAFLFVLVAVFITLWWLFGILIPITFLAIRDLLLVKHQRIELSKKDRDAALIVTSYIFTVFLLFFCVPSFIANNHANPKDRFPSDWDAVDSYTIYGTNAPHDREHVIPRSWYVNDNNFVNDFVNVIWSNLTANSERGNKQFCNIPKRNEFEIYSGSELVGYIKDDCFMPLDKYKGDVARIVLYMYVTYKDDGLNREHINLALMKTWAKLDPVSAEELQRNQTLQSVKGYYNKFVKIPSLIRFIV